MASSIRKLPPKPAQKPITTMPVPMPKPVMGRGRPLMNRDLMTMKAGGPTPVPPPPPSTPLKGGPATRRSQQQTTAAQKQRDAMRAVEDAKKTKQMQDAYDREEANIDSGMRKGGRVKKYAGSGSSSSASRRADGIAKKGKTRGKFV